MTKEKFIHDSETVLKFIQYYCEHEHSESIKINQTIKLSYNYEDLKTELNYELCEECKSTFHYSYVKLQECPHDEKPSCRKCPHPCYGKKEWKHLAKIMKYSGMRFGLLKIRKIFSRFDKSA